MRLQLEKTFGGDDRFKLDEDFDVSFGDANKSKAHVPDVMLGALSKREQEDFFAHKKEIKGSKVQINTGGYSSLDEDGDEVGQIAWKHGLNLEKERSSALNILSKIVPASEIFLTSSKSQNTKALAVGEQHNSSEIDKLTGKGESYGTKKRAMHIKRFDPSNP